MASKTINISLPEEMLAEVDELAHFERRTRSELFREAVRRYLSASSNLSSWTTQDRKDFASLSEPSLRRIWDNEKDAAYDELKPTRHGKAKA